MRANVTCLGNPIDSCGSVNGTLWYNVSIANPDNATLGSNLLMKPFYTLENNSWICGTMMGGDRCYINWTVNTTGDVGTTWKLAVNFTSTTSGILSNVTNYTLINIIASAISITLSQNLTDVQFGNQLNPGTTENLAVGNDPSVYNITCSNDAGNCNISIKANHFNLVSVTGASTFRIENVSWSSPVNTTSEVRRLNDTWDGVINATLGNTRVQRIFFWIDIPSAQSAENYKSNFTIKGQTN